MKMVYRGWFTTKVKLTTTGVVKFIMANAINAAFGTVTN